jgi:hypothetical protein
MTIILTVVLGANFMVDGGTTPTTITTIIPVKMVIFYVAIIILV